MAVHGPDVVVRSELPEEEGTEPELVSYKGTYVALADAASLYYTLFCRAVLDNLYGNGAAKLHDPFG